MANSKIDQNREKTLLGASSADAAVAVIPYVNSSGGMLVDETDETLTVTVGTVRKRDQNHNPTLCGVSSSDSSVIVPIHVSPSGRLLIQLV